MAAWGFSPTRLSDEERRALQATYRAQARMEKGVPWGFSYESEFILSNPMPARCVGCGYQWTGRDAIRAPSLRNCSCFWCHGELVALDLEAYAARLDALALHRIPYQASLAFT